MHKLKPLFIFNAGFVLSLFRFCFVVVPTVSMNDVDLSEGMTTYVFKVKQSFTAVEKY